MPSSGILHAMIADFAPELALSAGIVVHMALLLRANFPRDFFLILGVSIVGVCLGLWESASEEGMSIRETLYTYPFFALAPAFLFVGMIAFKYRAQVLPPIREHSLLVLTLLIWCVSALNGWFEPKVLPWTLGVLALPTLLILALSLTSVPLVGVWRYVAYWWFLVSLVVIGVTQVNGALVAFVLWRDPIQVVTLSGLFLAGMSIGYVAAHVWYIWEGALLLSPRLSSSQKQEILRAIPTTYEPDQLRAAQIVWIFLLVSTGYLLVERGLIDQPIFFSLGLLVLGQFMGRRRGQRVESI